jgi:hypothetical protein
MTGNENRTAPVAADPAQTSVINSNSLRPQIDGALNLLEQPVSADRVMMSLRCAD